MFFTPSDVLCVDESKQDRYGLGGDWNNFDLPTYLVIDRKPEIS